MQAESTEVSGLKPIKLTAAGKIRKNRGRRSRKPKLKVNQARKLNNAAWSGITADVKKYLNDDTVDVNWKCSVLGWTSLHRACHKGHYHIAELLLDHGANIDARSYGNETPLMVACMNGHASTTKLLLGCGCAVNAIKDSDGNTALHFACKEGSTECVADLLVHGADTSIKNKDGKTPFDIAGEKKHQTAHQTVNDLCKENEKRSISIQGVQIMPETSTIKAHVSSTEERLLLKVQAIIGSRCEEVHQDMVTNIEDMKETAKKLSSDVASAQKETSKTMKKLSKDIESKVETIINHRCEENLASQDKTNQSLDKLTNQLLIANAETAKCFSNLATMIGHLSSKISSIEGRLDSNEEVMKRNEEQMRQSLQRLTSEHLIDSNEKARANADPSTGTGTGVIDSERQKDVEDCVKVEEDSLSVLTNVKDELHQSLAYC